MPFLHMTFWLKPVDFSLFWIRSSYQNFFLFILFSSGFSRIRKLTLFGSKVSASFQSFRKYQCVNSCLINITETNICINLNVWVHGLIILETCFDIQFMISEICFSCGKLWEPDCQATIRGWKKERCDKVTGTAWLLLEGAGLGEDGLLKKGWLRHTGYKKNSVVKLFLFLSRLGS